MAAAEAEAAAAAKAAAEAEAAAAAKAAAEAEAAAAAKAAADAAAAAHAKAAADAAAAAALVVPASFALAPVTSDYAAGHGYYLVPYHFGQHASAYSGAQVVRLQGVVPSAEVKTTAVQQPFYFISDGAHSGSTLKFVNAKEVSLPLHG